MYAKESRTAAGRFGSLGSGFRLGLRRRLAMLLALVVTGAAAGVGLGLMRSQEVTAESSILISPLDGNPFSPTSDDLINLETEAQLVSSDPVARLVVGPNDSSPGSVLGSLEVSVIPNTQIVSMSYTAGNRADAVAFAQSFADEYLDYRSARSASVVESRSERIQDQIDAQSDNLSDLVSQSGATGEGAGRAVLREQISGVNAQIAQLRTQLDELRTGAVDPGQVISPAEVTSPSTSLLVAGFAVAGGGLGLTIGLLLVILRVRAENRLHLADDVTAADLTLLGDIGQQVIDATDAQVVSGDVRTEISPELRRIRVAVLSGERRRPVRILFGTSAAEESGPRTAIGLSYAAAASGYRTMLVDATPDGREVTERLELSGRPGFNDVLAGSSALEDVPVRVVDHLEVIPAGKHEPRIEDWLTGPGVATIFDRLADLADIVVIATGPMLNPRSQALSLISDASVVEAVQGVTGIDELVEIGNDISPVAMLGVVFVRPDHRDSTRSSQRARRGALSRERSRDAADAHA